MINRSLRGGGYVAALSALLQLAGCVEAEDPADAESAPGGNLTTKRAALAAATANCDPGTPCLTNPGGRVLGNLKVVNIFMSSDWDGDNSGFNITKQAINDFTQKLVTSSYFAAAKTDYGFNSASFGGSFEASGLSRVVCPTPSFGGFTDFFLIHAWITCMATAGPIPISSADIGLEATLGNIPAPDDGTLYVIYVPKGTNINDLAFKTCGDFGAYHFWHDVAKWSWDCGIECVGCAADFCKPLCCLACTPVCGPHLTNQLFAYAVIPAECSGGNLDELTEMASHEIIEATTDPIVPTAWIDRTSATFLINEQMLKSGEVSDICSSEGPFPTPAVTMGDGNVVSPYWSTSAQACFPPQAVSARCQDVTVPTSPLSCSAPASVNAGSSDPTGAAVTLTPNPPGPYGLGTTTVVLTASSPASATATCTGHVTVVDRTPPVFSSVPPNVVVTVGMTPALGTPSVADACPGSVTVTNNAPSTFPIGVTTVTWTAVDAAGNSAMATQTVTVTCAGGPGSCPNGNTCQTNADCGSKVCTAGVCTPPTCATQCNQGAPCGANGDCGSQVCVGNTCRAPACSPRCTAGAICGDNSNCSSFVCTQNICRPPSCAPNCNQGAPCGADSDCSARVCRNGQCQPPACSPNCARGARCNNNGDCRSHVCNAAFCT